MQGFDHILHWKLKRGSHPFPGKDGGTCINEAALVAAGFEYRPINKPKDMPACFSQPICRLAMQLNDEASEADRQRLLPYVTRLACADTPEVECKRAAYIARHTKHLPIRRRLAFTKGLEVLEGVLAIGRQADALAFEDVQSRMEHVKSRALVVQRNTAKAASPEGSHLLSKLKSLFGVTSKPEAVG